MVSSARNVSLTPFSNTDGHEPFSRTFDFAKSPNLREVKFSVYWTSGSLLWIPKALSTIKPTTSPRISDIELNFSGLSPWYTPRDSRERLFNELQLIEDEVARIKCEFVGVVNLTVHQNPGFGVGELDFNLWRASLTDPPVLTSFDTEPVRYSHRSSPLGRRKFMGIRPLNIAPSYILPYPGHGDKREYLSIDM